MASQAPLGTKPLWNTEGVGLPGYVREIARSLMENGKSKSQAIQLAIGIVRRWAHGGGNVTEKTRAKAAKAVAEFEAARARAKATPNKTAHEVGPNALALATVELDNSASGPTMTTRSTPKRRQKTYSDPKSGSTTVSKADADDPRVKAMANKLHAKGYGPWERCVKVATAIIRRGKGAKGGNTAKVAAAQPSFAPLDAEGLPEGVSVVASGGVRPKHLALGNGPSCQCGGPHDLVFYENRSTPQVVDAGKPAEPKKGYGKVTRRRRANASEEKQIKSGQWIRVDQSGNTPSDDGYKKTQLRPQLTASQEATVPATLALSVEQVATYLALAKHRAAQRYRHGWIPIVPEAKRGGPGKHAKADDAPSKSATKSRTAKAASGTASKVATGEKADSAADHATRISAADGLRGARSYIAGLSTPDLKAVDVEMRRRRELLGSKAKNPRHQAVKDEIAKRLKRKTTSTSKPSVKAAHGRDNIVTDFDIDAARLALSNLQTQLDELALAMPPALAKAQAAKKASKKTAKPSSSNSMVNPDAAESDVQIPAGQEDAFKKLVAQIMKRPGMDQEKAEKVAAALLRNRKPAKSNA